MSVNGVPFLTHMSWKINFRTARAVDNRSNRSMITELESIFKMYNGLGITIDELLIDNEFACIRDHFSDIHVNLAAANEHVGDVENFIKVLKERCWCIANGLLFQYWPRVMITSMVTYVVSVLNAPPSNNGVSSTFSPSTIVTGRRPSKLQLAFGAYAQVVIESDPAYNMIPRTIGAICLGPSGNEFPPTIIKYNRLAIGITRRMG